MPYRVSYRTTPRNGEHNDEGLVGMLVPRHTQAKMEHKNTNLLNQTLEGTNYAIDIMAPFQQGVPHGLLHNGKNVPEHL